MNELYLCYAGFAYYVTKHGYSLSKQGKGVLFLILPNSEKFHIFSVYKDEESSYCGVIYTTYGDLEFVFHDNPELLQMLKTLCVKPRWRHPENRSSHCSIDPSLRGKLVTNIQGGEIVRCLHEKG